MPNGDLYAELGVSKSAGASEIKSAYRKLARELHPDLNPGDAKAEERFKRVSYAHHVLSDAKRRKLYDEFGEDGLREGFNPEAARAQGRWSASGGSSGFGGVSGFEEFLRQARRSGSGGGGFGSIEDVLGGAGVEDLFGGFGRQRGVRRPVQEAEITVTFHEAVRGAEKELSLRDSDGERSIRVRIPAGVKEGGKVRLRGQGARFAAGDRGDLLLTVKVLPHAYYRRQGDYLHVDVPVTLGEAYRGEAVTVPTPDGQVSLKIPKGVRGGTKLRLRGRGVPRRDGSVGDLFAHIQLRLPSGQSEKLDALFRDLDATYGAESIRKDLE